MEESPGASIMATVHLMTASPLGWHFTAHMASLESGAEMHPSQGARAHCVTE